MSCKDGHSYGASRPSFAVTTVIQEGVAELRNVGVCHHPNWKLTKARKQSHRLNLLVMGPPGVGKSSLINTLFSSAIIPEERDRLGTAEPHPQLAAFHGERVEGGVCLKVEATEVLGYTSPARLEEEGYAAGLLDWVRQRHYSCYENECQSDRNLDEAFDGLIHVVLYFVPPTFQQFSEAELDLFRALQKLTLLLPVLAKADMYTPRELKSRKMMLRAQFKASTMECLPNLLQGHRDTWLVNEFNDLMEKWPLAIISSTKTYRHVNVEGQEENVVRARVYPWGVIDIDDAEYSDLLSLEKLLITTFLVLGQQYTKEQLYEGIWRPSFMMESGKQGQALGVMSQKHSPAVSDSSVQATPIATASAASVTLMKHQKESSMDSVLSQSSANLVRSSSQGSVKAACALFESRQP